MLFALFILASVRGILNSCSSAFESDKHCQLSLIFSGSLYIAVVHLDENSNNNSRTNKQAKKLKEPKIMLFGLYCLSCS